MSNWREGPRHDRDYGPLRPSAWPGNHHWDGRLRARLADNPGLSAVVVDVPQLRSGLPSFTVLTHDSGFRTYEVHFQCRCPNCGTEHASPVVGRQVEPYPEHGLIPAAWLESTEPVVAGALLEVSDWELNPEEIDG